MELGPLDGNRAKQDACRSLLEACKAPAVLEPAWYIKWKVTLQLAQLLRNDGQLEEANEKFGLARSLSRHAPVPPAQNNMEFDIRYAELKSTTLPYPLQNHQSWVVFYDQCSSKTDYYMMCEGLRKAAETALEILQKQPNEENKSNFWQWQSKAEDLLARLGDFYSLYFSRVTTGDIALHMFDQYGAILRWHDEFDAAHPQFNVWFLKMAGKRSKLLIYSRLNDTNNALRTIKEINGFEKEQETFWSTEEYIHPTIAAPPMGDTENQKISNAIHPSDILRNAWFREWADEWTVSYKYPGAIRFDGGTFTLGQSFVNEELLLEWMRSSAKNGELAETELEQILFPRERTGQTPDLHDLLDQLTPGRLSELLYGPQDSPTTYAYWETAFSVIADWLLNRAKYDIEKRFYVTLHLQERKFLSISSPFSRDDLQIAQTLFDVAAKPPEALAPYVKNWIPMWRNKLCKIKEWLYNQETGHVFQTEEDPQFQEIVRLYKITLKEVREMGSPHMEAVTLQWLGELYYSPAMNHRQPAVENFMEALEGAELAFQKNRDSWKILNGWEKVQKLLMSLEEYTMRLGIAPLVISVLQQFPGCDDPSSDVGPRIWACIQRGKSFGLAWLMRTNFHATPGTPEIGSDGNIGAKFEETPVITPDELGLIAQDAGSDVIFVDWFRPLSYVAMSGQSLPLVAVLSPGEPVKIAQVLMTWEEVDALLEKILKFSTDDLLKEENLQILRKLNPLIEPLATLSRPGQVLVFSAVGTLHRIPLHALQLCKELLIRRNPIVYCSNMTVLNIAFQERKSSEKRALESKRQFHAAIFGDAPSDVGQTSVRKIAKVFSVEPHIRDSFTSSNFIDAILDPNLDLFHYHGHVAFEENSPTEHCLKLDDRDVTLRDIFSLASAPTRSAYHATLLGCGSGMSKTHVSTDVIGLVPAFLYAGAASTVSTLWSFDDADAAMYAHYFYAEFRTLLRERRNARVDLARANQKAVLSIMEKRPEMYHWAPFVLNGYWMMDVRGEGHV